MSFKIKKWSALQHVDVADYYPYATPSQAGLENVAGLGMSFCWLGKVYFLCYDSTRADAEGKWAPPIWCVYDPADGSWEGPFDLDYTPGGNAWLLYSPFDGDDRKYVYWGSEFFMCFPGMQGQAGTKIMYGWNQAGEFVVGTHPATRVGEADLYTHYGAGVDAEGNLAVLREERSYAGGIYQSGTVVTMSLNGGTILRDLPPVSVPKIYHVVSAGLVQYWGKPIGSAVQWYNNNECAAVVDQGCNLYSLPPTEDEICSSILANVSMESMHGYPWKVGDEAWVTMHQKNSGGTYDAPYNALASAPTVPITYPYSTWEARALNEGLALTLNERDLDGVEHGSGLDFTFLGQPTFNHGDGYFTALSLSDGASAVIHRLDPDPPIGRAVLPHRPGNDAIGWLGDYAIRPNLKVEAVLPFPDDRASSLDSAPPQEQATHVLGQKEIFKRAGGALTYHKDLVVELSGYPTALPAEMTDWNWPGDWIDKDHHHGFWSLFAGESAVVIGRMPDPDWGMVGLVGQDMMYGLGLPTANIASPTASAFVLHDADSIAGTTFAGALNGGTNPRRMLISSPDGPARFYYYQSQLMVADMPDWHAVAGNVVGGSFVPTFDPGSGGFDIPDLGQTPGQNGWTIWSIVPIKPCRALPKGGYLVGATLYFNPWAPGDWDVTAGARDLTFRDSGQGWVPALPGADGPSTCLDYHAPIYLGIIDEWTANRSLYGPDALLVFDDTGAFVECLNSANLYPPNGREIMVTREPWPRLIFRIYRHGTYSDYAEAWGQYHRLATDEEIQAPMYACYDLMDARGRIAPGAGTFRGFLDMHDVGRLGGSWRWDSCAPNLYDTSYPKSVWSPPGPVYVRTGKGGLTITPLAGGPTSTRNGVRGVGSRA